MKALSAILLLAAAIWWAGSGIAALHRAEAAHGRAIAAAAMPRLTGPPGRTLPARSARDARDDLARRIGDAGAEAGLRLSLIPAPPGETLGTIATLRLVVRGDEARLLRFSAIVEHGAPLIRFTRWSILPDGDGALRLSAEAAAPVLLPADGRAATGPVAILPVAKAAALPATPIFAPVPFTGEGDAPSGDGEPRLIGIVGRLPDDAQALVRTAAGATRALGKGQAIEGWTVVAIAADRVTLSRNGRASLQILPPASDPAQ